MSSNGYSRNHARSRPQPQIRYSARNSIAAALCRSDENYLSVYRLAEMSRASASVTQTVGIAVPGFTADGF